MKKEVSQITKENEAKFVKKVDAICMDCGYDSEREDPCVACPIRKAIDNMASISGCIDIERVKFRYNYLDDCGKNVLVKADEVVTLMDAIPEGDETAEDVKSLCDIVDSCGKRITRTLWINITGLYCPY